MKLQGKDREKPREHRAVCIALSKNASFHFILFGSHVNDHIRGGDSDLLILPNEPLENSYEKKLALSAALKNEIGDQKIDVILASRADPLQR
jgi:hypothetical protein